MALDYDFFIGALGFNLYITKDKPYERATAQFRKDQIDQSSKVGDQSLTGWWTRGQLSFHKGAGENYYEVTDGEEVLNRYKDSEGVEVFEPGEVTLLKSLDNIHIELDGNGISTGAVARDAVPAPLAGGGGIYALTSLGVQYTAGSSNTFIATSNAAVPTYITTSGKHYYVCNGTKIERQFDATLTRTNHVTNPSFESNTTGWTVTNTSIATSANHSKYGSRSLLVGASTSAATVSTTLTGLSIGQTYKASAWVYRDPDLFGSGSLDATVPHTLKIDSTSIASTSSVSTWRQLSGTFTATATSHDLTVAIGAPVSGTVTPALYLDAVLFTESPFTDDYFDGSQPGCAWAGAANGSKSTYSTSTGTASVDIITLTGSTWDRAWWAKGRLFAVDAAGYFYALADAVAAVTNADAFWNSGRTGVNWSLADSPGAVYISDGTTIYSITVGTDGLVPTIGTPTTVTQVPAGETISSITYYLGNLIMATSAGVRVALIQNDQVYLGPLVIEGDFSTSGRAGVWDTKVYLVGRPTGQAGNYTLCAIDLSQEVTDLTYAWAPLATLSTVTSTAHGAAVDAAGRLYSWTAGVMYLANRDAFSSSGYVQTAYHRYGTLDGKNFSSVLVRTGGDGGTVAVSRIDGDGTETALDTITVPASGTSVIDLGLTAPAERVALKFTLTPDSDTTKGPTLLGYQLRALPAPKRQRMIRVPLFLFDKERNRNGQEMGGNAQDRRAALEALEESNAVVTFDDKVHGETGTAFIEAVEVSEVAAAGRESPGGLLYVTLRRLS